MRVLMGLFAAHHAWDTGAPEGVCWVCVGMAVAATLTVVGCVLAFRDEAARA